MKPTLKVTVTTAIELTKKQVNSILKAVEKNNIIELKQVVDPSVIGGIKITVGAEEIDATIYTKREKLHNQLRKNT